jgi:hypothetical protein
MGSELIMGDGPPLLHSMGLSTCPFHLSVSWAGFLVQIWLGGLVTGVFIEWRDLLACSQTWQTLWCTSPHSTAKSKMLTDSYLSFLTMARVSQGVTMTPTPSQVMARAGNQYIIEKDKDKVRDYVKEKLYERVIFIWKKAPLTRAACSTETT